MTRYNRCIALHDGLMKREYGKFHGIGLADAIIAATAKAHNAVLYSLNRKHFLMLANLQNCAEAVQSCAKICDFELFGIN